MSQASKEVLNGLVSGSAIRSHGWKLTRPRTLAIAGGPEVTVDEIDGQTHQYIELGDQFDNFRIWEPFVSLQEVANTEQQSWHVQPDIRYHHFGIAN